MCSIPFRSKKIAVIEVKSEKERKGKRGKKRK
jgi:hypothetical protein